MPTPSRRDVLKAGGLIAAGAVVATGLGSTNASAAAPAGAWARAETIAKKAPRLRRPKHTVAITDFGATPDAVATDAIAAAINHCHGLGGGRVVVPSGTFSTGAIHLRSNVELHLAAGSTLAFVRDTAAYPMVYTRWQGIECYNYSPFIYAFEQENIAITGSGTLDGQAGKEFWWPWCGNSAYGWQAGDPTESDDWTTLQEFGDNATPVADRVFGPGHYLRPNFIQPYRCRNVIIDGISIVNSPMWEIHPVLSQNVLVRNVTVDSHGPNNDGCDPESCSTVVITGCQFSTGDDCIAVKSGRNADGRRVNVPSKDILITDCTFADGHGGITIGSEMSGGVSNVFAQNLHMTSADLEIALRLKTNSLRGGYITDIYLRNSVVDQVSDSGVQIAFNYENEGPDGGFNPLVRNIQMDGVQVGACDYPLYLLGNSNDLIHDILISNTTFAKATSADYVVNVDDLQLRNVTINGSVVSARH